MNFHQRHFIGWHCALYSIDHKTSQFYIELSGGIYDTNIFVECRSAVDGAVACMTNDV